MCPPGHAEWGVCLLLEQVVGLTNTRQMAVCDEGLVCPPCKVHGELVRLGGPSGAVRERGS